METKRSDLLAPYRIDYQLKPGNDELIIILHGYGQKSAEVYEELKSILPPESTLLIPNGPFPIPGKVRTKENLGYAWYFYDSESDEYYIPYTTAVTILKSLIQELGLENHKKTIIGFSQGGYFAGFLAEELSHINQVLALNASIRTEYLKNPTTKYPIHAFNGEDDQMVDPVKARQRHDDLEKLGLKGDFHLIPETGHRINQALLKRVKNYLLKS